MQELSAAAILEKNKLAGDSCWPVLLEVQIADLGDPLRLTSNIDPITWGGHTWTPFPFELDDVSEDGKGEVQALNLRVSNVTQEIQYYLEQAQGAVDSPVIIRVVNSKHLDETTPMIRLDFVVAGSKYDARWITFSLGGSQSLTQRIPERRNLKDCCQYREYGGIECGASAETLALFPTCRRTLADCRQRNNSPRFGGEPSIPLGGFYA